jgi:hypothetical protein
MEGDTTIRTMTCRASLFKVYHRDVAEAEQVWAIDGDDARRLGAERFGVDAEQVVARYVKTRVWKEAY